MTADACQQQVSRQVTKKDVPQSSRKRAKNVLASRQPPHKSEDCKCENVLERDHTPELAQTSKRGAQENALELARSLCVLANVQPPQRTDISNAVWKSKRRDRFAAVFDLIGKPEWKANLDAILRFFPYGIQQIDEVIERHLVGKDMVRALYTLRQCRTVAANLTGLFASREPGYEFFVREERSFRAHTDNTTGRVLIEPYSLLGPYQDAFLRALDHPKIDARRFRLCEACSGFFYQPRWKSRACSRKCEDVLMSRVHYYREKECRARVRELRKHLYAQGKSVSLIVSSIAAELGLKPSRVRRYLNEGRHNGTQA
jgi:hypothetical protein